jgi:hypothetical protein
MMSKYSVEKKIVVYFLVLSRHSPWRSAVNHEDFFRTADINTYLKRLPPE